MASLLFRFLFHFTRVPENLLQVGPEIPTSHPLTIANPWNRDPSHIISLFLSYPPELGQRCEQQSTK